MTSPLGSLSHVHKTYPHILSSVITAVSFVGGLGGGTENNLVCLLHPSKYLGADKSLARPTSRCILFDGENISFDASLVIQGVTGGTDQTSGECSLGQTIPI